MNEITVQTPADVEAELPAVVSWARSLAITTADDYAEAGERLAQIKGMAKRIAAFFSPMKKRADEAKKSILDAEKKLSVPLADAEKLTKDALQAWDDAQAAKAEAERCRLQAIADEQARKEREKAEQEAARQRAIEAEARAKAEAARLAAEQASAAERKRLLAEAAAADRKAAAAAVKVEAQQDQAAAVIAPVIHVATVTPTVEGMSRRATWKPEIIDRQALLEYICKNNRHDLIIINEKMIEAYAKSMKQGATMPGVRFFEERSIASRSY